VSKANSSPDTRQRILDSAHKLFHRNGYQAVGINAICTDAAVVKGSFYHFFPSKQALLSVVLEELTAGQQAAMRNARKQSTSGREAIMAFFGNWLESAEQQLNSGGQVLGCCLGLLSAELSCSEPETRKLLQNSFSDWHKQWKEQIRAGIEDGSIAPSVDPAHTADALLALLQGLSTLGRTGMPLHRMRESALLGIKRLLPVPSSS
jgi:TetR/AcrR family transcriptional repressor of nem operon